MTRKREGGCAVNDSLNKPKLKAGLDWRVWIGCAVVALFVCLLVSVLFGSVLLFALPFGLMFFFRKDPKIFQLWQLSFDQRSYYDPGKAVRS